MITAADVADAVTELLADWLEQPGGDDLPPATVRRVAVIRMDAADLDAVTLSVIPRSASSEFISRGALSRDIGIDVAVQKRLDGFAADTAGIDDMTAFTERVIQCLASRANDRISVGDFDLRLTEITQDPLYFQNHLLEKSVYTSVISLTYGYAESIP